MTSVKTALLFVGNPTLALEHFVDSLGKRLAALGITAEEISPPNGAIIAFKVAGVTVTISASATPLAATNFVGSMDSPLSKPFIGLLVDTLARQTRQISVSVSEPPEHDTGDTGGADHLMRLKIAHATTSLLAEWHMPAAVHWQQSNQLITGAQYLQLAAEPCPWALFARAHVTYAALPDQKTRNHGVQLDEAADFIGRPIKFMETSLPLDEAHAAALSFLRHAVESGSPIPDGHTFGAADGTVFTVAHIAASQYLPAGRFELSVVQGDVAQGDADTALGDPARSPGAVLPDHGPPLPLTGVAAPHPRERTRSMAIGYLMLVIMPPVGAILLMSNAIFGSNVFRTGVVAAASVALAVLVGTYTFINNGQDSALILQNDVIRSVILAD